MRKFKLNSLILLGIFLSFFGTLVYAEPKGDGYFYYDETDTPEDSLKGKKSSDKRPTYEEKDRRGDEFSNKTSESPLLLDRPSNIETDVTLDSSGRFFTVEEKVGDNEYRPPTIMSYDDYMKYQHRETLKNYWQNKSGDSSGLRARKDPKAGPLSLKIPVKGLEGPFGSDFVDIKPNGLVTLDFGYKHQHTYNPQVPKRQQKQGSFDFDNQIQLNVIGKIGEKLKLTVNWDTKATFEFQNNFKIEYTGYEHDILQKIEVGQVSMPINSSLIQGAQNLFGIKTKMQFGRLTMTNVLATQRGKSESITAQGGSTARTVELKADGYDEYRHFFIGHFFRDNYERSLRSLPMVLSGVTVTQIDVYVTNSNNTTTNTRDMVAFLDLGETQKHSYNQDFSKFSFNSGYTENDNKTNGLYDKFAADVKNPITLSDAITSQNFAKGTEFEIINSARKLKPEEFTYNPELGYISLVSPIRSYEVLAVAYQYSYKGEIHTVGDASAVTSVIQGADSTSALILKLLKPSSIKTRLNSWDLMMKNIYSLGSTQISKDNFQFRVIYRDDLSGADLPNLQDGQNTKNIPIVRLLQGDQLNLNGDPYPDGNLDYVDRFTIDAKNGRVIFPVLEPFGSGLQRFFDPTTEADLINKYVFSELYDSTKSDASQIAAKNKYYFKGRFQSSSSRDIPLQGAINLAPGSVRVTAGSRTLVEGKEFSVDYSQGKVTILDESILASNQEIKISYEKQDLFNVRQKSFYGSRLDYRISKDFNIGGTILHQNERPTLTRVNIGDEPSSNTIWGLDANGKRESRFLTKLVDKLPLIQTKVPSMITAQGEVAQLLPGHNKALDQNGDNGAAYLDDFEAAETPYDFSRSPSKWKIASTPIRFAESSKNNRSNGENRALMAWYNADPSMYQNPDNFSGLPDGGIKNFYERQVSVSDVFSNFNATNPPLPQTIFDITYFPTQRGPYNYNPLTTINNVGGKRYENIPNPTGNWAGIMREIRNDVDFDNANIQYIEFWVLNPYIKPNSNGYTNIDGQPFDLNNNGKLYFNLGTISEDVLKDSRLEYENGLPVAGETTTSITPWGIVSNQQPLTNAFSSQTEARDKQDVGLDGLNNEAEKSFPGTPAILQNSPDPAGDDFRYYDEAVPSIIDRYKIFNGTDKNSPVNNTNSSYSTPDNEDLNLDNTLNTIDEYYEYEIDIKQSTLVKGVNPYIVGVTKNPKDSTEWLQFRVPIRQPTTTVGGISGFKTIRFMRMYMTGFSDPIALRFAQLQLVSNQWRPYILDDINQTGFGSVNEPDDAQLVVSTVNIEKNGKSGGGVGSSYVLPPGNNRDQDPTAVNGRKINEQSLRLSVDNLDNTNARAAFKNVTFDLLNYKRLAMFVHAETDPAGNTKDGDMNAFMRLGTDYTKNYYEIEVPLYFSTPDDGQFPDVNNIWKSENEIDISIQDLIDVKLERNKVTSNKNAPYSKTINGKIINVVGNPDLSTTTIAMIGMRNPAKNSITGLSNDITPKSATIWANELRVTDFENKSGWAGTGNVNVKLADLANVTGSVRYTTVGFGGLDQKISQRQRANTLSYGATASVTLDKFIPEKLGIRLPMYVSYDRTMITPQYNPLDPDVKMSKYSKAERDTLSKLVRDITTRRAINFTNFKKVKTKKDAKNYFFDISNFSFTVGYNEVVRTSFEIKEYKLQNYKAAIDYTYTIKSKPIEPFKKSAFAKSKYLRLVKDFNVNPLPSSFTFRNDLDRRIVKTQYYEAGPLTPGQVPLYEKSFILTRTYGLPWNITKSINMTYSATANAIIDEPNRAPGDQAYKDTLWKNFASFGRLKQFNQTATTTYKLPLDKIPFLSWLSADANYNAGFNWTAGPVNLRDSTGKTLNLGNLATNKGDLNFTGKINLETLYNKVKFLKEINTPKQEQRNGPQSKPVPKNPKDTTEQVKKPDLKVLKAALRMVMLVKNIMPTYGINRTTQLPGYMPVPMFIGVDAKGDYDQSGRLGEVLPFVFGSQDPRFRFTAANRGWITKESELNAPYTQMRNHTFTAKTAVEPIRDFKVQLDIKKSKGSNYQEIFRVTEDTTGNDIYRSFSPSRNGSYSISFISILTAFTKTRGASNVNSTFQRFESNREIILARLNNPNYIKNSQDVLVPSLLAAYSGRDANKQKLTSFPKIPLPNWNITYSGLSRLGFFKEKFSSVMLKHGYTSTYAVGAFQSALIYGDGFIRPEFDITKGIAGDSLNKEGVIIPIYTFADVTIREQFGPLFGIDLKSKGKTTYRFEYKRGRNLALSLSNAQLREDINQDFVFGISYLKTGLKLPKFQGRSTVLKNELTLRLDMTVRDTKSYQRKLEQGTTVTAGNLNFQVKPTASYMVSQRVTMLFYFEHTRAWPRLSSSFKRNTTSFGLQIRFTLS